MKDDQIDKMASTQYEMGRIFAVGMKDQLTDMGMFDKQASSKPQNLGDSLRERWGVSKTAGDVPESYGKEKNYGGAYKADPSKKEGEDAPADESGKKTEPGADARVKSDGQVENNDLEAGAVGEGQTHNAGSEDTSNPGATDGTSKTAGENVFLQALEG